VLKALEVPGQVLDLPALFRADLFTFLAAAGAGALCRAQLVDLRGGRQVLEIRQSAPTPPPLHPPPFPGRLARRRGLLRGHRLLRQFLAEIQQRLRQLAGRFQPVRARPVVPLLVALQF
jgi:hypothetical protein